MYEISAYVSTFLQLLQLCLCLYQLVPSSPTGKAKGTLAKSPYDDPLGPCCSSPTFQPLGLVLYVVMGWAVVIVIKDIVAALMGPAFWLLLAGGLSYTGGIVFYKLKYKYMHSIWHLFVFGGSLLHYLCVVLYVLPMSY